MIKLTPANEDPELYRHLAKAYVNELKKFDKRIIWDNSKWSKAVDISQFIENDGDVIGFAVSATENFGAGLTYFIRDFYVAPKWRKKGFGKQAVGLLTQAWRGDVTLYTLDKNMPSKSFWASMEKNLGWYRKMRSDVPEQAGFDLRVYGKKARGHE